MKAISNVIATLLMMIITIALAGVAWLYIAGVFTSRISYTFSLLGGDVVAGYPEILLSNDGTNIITTINSIAIDGNPVNFSVLPDNGDTLVGYWQFDEGSGTTAHDTSGNGNDGTLYNGSVICADGDCPTWVDEKYGKALSFDGSNDYVKLPSVNPREAITVCAWVKSEDNYYRAVWQLVSKYSAYILGTSCWNCKNVCFIIHNGAGWQYGSCYNVPDPKNWHFFCGTYDSSASNNRKKLYVDGEFKSATNPPGLINNDAGPINIAQRECCPRQVFHGLIDEVKIYNRTLSPEEIKAIYNIGGMIPSGTVGRIRLYPSTALTTGTHTVRVCLPGMCQTTYVYVR